MNTRALPRCKLPMAVVAAVLGIPSVQATPLFDYSAGIRFEHSDNIELSPTDPVSQNLLIPTLTASIDSKGSDFDASAAASFEYRDYLGGAYADEFRNQLSGIVDWKISPQRFDWVVEDYLGRQPINALASDAPSNQQQTNVFSTGPTLRARLASNWRGQFDLRYTNAHADVSSEFNSDRYSAAAHAIYELDPTNTLTGTVSSMRVRYGEEVSRPFNYDRDDAFVSYRRDANHFNLVAALGYSHLDLRNRTRTGPMLSATAQWTPTTQTSLGITLQRQFSDATQDLMIDPARIGNVGIGSGLNGAVITPEIYVEKYLGIDFSHRGERFRIGVSPFLRQHSYIEGDFPNDRSRGGYVDGSYFLGPTLSLNAFLGFEHRRYTQIERADDDSRYGLSLSWQRTPHWIWTAGVARSDRNSDAELADYTESTVFLSLTYKR